MAAEKKLVQISKIGDYTIMTDSRVKFYRKEFFVTFFFDPEQKIIATFKTWREAYIYTCEKQGYPAL